MNAILAFLGRPGGRRVVAERREGGVWIAVLDRGEVAESVLLSLDEFRALVAEVPAALSDLGDAGPEEVTT